MPNGFFIIINDEQVNAFAMKKNDISVVAINAGSIKKIMYSANLMMLSDKILLGIGDMSACRENIIAEEYPITEDGDNVAFVYFGRFYKRSSRVYDCKSCGQIYVVS